MKWYWLIIPCLAGGLLIMQACSSEAISEQEDRADWLHSSMYAFTETMVHDIFSPPLATRAYRYASTAAYEALVPAYPEYQSMAGQARGLDSVPQPETSQAYDFQIAAVQAFLNVAEQLVFSRNLFGEQIERMERAFEQSRTPRAVRRRSIEYGNEVAAHILAWAASDNYRQTRGMSSFTVTEEPGRWVPTPPGYMDAIEPNWQYIRPVALDSASQFRPNPPVPFSMEEGSAFYDQVMDVYEATTEMNEEEREIASFWDCNPYTLHIHGHAKFATKQMSPGAHWMGVAANAARQDGRDIMGAAESYMLTAYALSDGFISNWDEKYRSQLVRPETVINRHIDEAWIPLLQTPPFPEYTSGHSVISRAAAEALTSLYGDNFAYADTTVVDYGLPERNFNSFYHASEEAAISRLYGGIHYPMAIEEGVKQGEKVGRFVVDRITTRERDSVPATASRR